LSCIFLISLREEKEEFPHFPLRSELLQYAGNDTVLLAEIEVPRVQNECKKKIRGMLRTRKEEFDKLNNPLKSRMEEQFGQKDHFDQLVRVQRAQYEASRGQLHELFHYQRSVVCPSITQLSEKSQQELQSVEYAIGLVNGRMDEALEHKQQCEEEALKAERLLLETRGKRAELLYRVRLRKEPFVTDWCVIAWIKRLFGKAPSVRFREIVDHAINLETAPERP
jgi:hypothetical protein